MSSRSEGLRAAMVLCLGLLGTQCTMGAPEQQQGGAAERSSRVGGMPTLSASPATVLPGTTVDVTLANGPGNRADWVALLRSDAPDSPAGVIDWQYLNGSKTPPDMGLTAATLHFSAPGKPGTYQFRFYLNDVYDKAATSNNVQVAAPTLTASPAMATTGAFAVVHLSGGPGNRADWVALLRSDAPDSPAGVIDWQYLNGTRTVPDAGQSNATLVFTLPSKPGTYQFRFYTNDSYDKLATSNDVQVSAPVATLVASPTAVGAGQKVTVSVGGSPGNRTDWIGLFKSTSSDEGLIDWFYLNGSKTAPASGLTSATVTFTMPTTPGEYNFRLFLNDVYDKNATSNNVTVVNPMITVSAAEGEEGATINVTVTGGPGNATDWIALAREGSDDRILLDWKYLNGTRTAPATGLTTATVSFTLPRQDGKYNFRLFSSDGFQRLALSPTVKVD